MRWYLGGGVGCPSVEAEEFRLAPPVALVLGRGAHLDPGSDLNSAPLGHEKKVASDDVDNVWNL